MLGAPVVGDLLSLGGLVALGLRPLRRLLAPWGAPVDRSAVEPGPADRWWASWRSFMTEQRALLSELPAISARLPMVRAPVVVVDRPHMRAAFFIMRRAPRLRIPMVAGAYKQLLRERT